MNVHDSEIISTLLENIGFEKTKNINSCDVYIINSCSVRQAAEDSVYGLGKTIKTMKKKPFVMLAGCMVGSATGKRKRYSLDYIKNKIPWVDAFISPNDIVTIPSIVSTILPPGNEKKISPLIKRASGDWAFVNISFGCDNFCTFCVVPYAKGEEVSRTKDEILKEIHNLIKKGYSKFTFLGQNVNSWGLSKDRKFKIRAGSAQKLPFAKLIREVCALKKVKKVSFMSANPFDFTMDLVEAISHQKVDRYIHIAVQSGDNKILKAMGRRHTAEEFVNLVKAIRKSKPKARIGTDIIVGFPGETKKQFNNTVKLCKKVKFNNAYIAMYSERKGTKAAALSNSINLEEKKKRHGELLKAVKLYKNFNFKIQSSDVK